MNSLATWTTRNSQGTFNKEKMLRKENLLLLKKMRRSLRVLFFCLCAAPNERDVF